VRVIDPVFQRQAPGGPQSTRTGTEVEMLMPSTVIP